MGLKIRFAFSFFPNIFPLLKFFLNNSYLRNCMRLSAGIHTKHCKMQVLLHVGPLKPLCVMVMM